MKNTLTEKHLNPYFLNEEQLLNLKKVSGNLNFCFTDLRDGNQNPLVRPSTQNQIEVGKLISNYIFAVNGILEGGYAGACNGYEKYKSLKENNIAFSIFGSSKIKNTILEEHFKSMLEVDINLTTIFVKSRASDVENGLGISLEENLENIKKSVKYLKNNQKKVTVDMEHFFDGFIQNKDYAVNCINVALDAGAESIILCDTLGKTSPQELEEIIINLFADTNLSKEIKGKCGLHLHEDFYNTGESLIRALGTGHINHIQGNFARGCGERVGNSSIVNLWTSLYEKYGIDIFEKNENKDKLWGNLLKTYARVTKILTDKFPDKMHSELCPENYCHAAGMHNNGLKKDSESYSVVSQELRNLLGIDNFPALTTEAGKDNVKYYLQLADLTDSNSDEFILEMLNFLKDQNGITFTDNIATFLLESYIHKNGCTKLQPYINKFMGIKFITNHLNIDEDENSHTKIVIEFEDEKEKTFWLDYEDKENGVFHVFAETLKNKLKLKYPYIENLELLDYNTHSDKSSTNVPVNTKLVFKDSTNCMIFSVIARNFNADIAGFNAIKQAYLYYILCKEGKITHIQDKILETHYGKIDW